MTLRQFTGAGLYRNWDSSEKTGVKHIYISPHSDDVALSCGGQIVANPGASDDTLVLNIFSSVGDEAHQSALFDSINAERTAEDHSAWESVGIKCASANLPEALIRKKFPFRMLSAGRNEDIIDPLYRFLEVRARSSPNAAFYFPAGIGSHVDHLACREAAFRLLDEGLLSRIFLYEDLPYCWLRFVRRQFYERLARTVEFDEESRRQVFRRDGLGLADYLLGKAVPFPRGRALFSLVYASGGAAALIRSHEVPARSYRAKLRTIALDDDGLKRKRRLVEHYRSQLPMLFGSDPELVLGRLRTSFAKEVIIEIEKIDPAPTRPLLL